MLTNPKYTGHMVWNRRARKSGGNTANPLSAWVWSPQPVHDVLVDLDTFIQVQQISGHRFGFRSTPEPNRHPHTRRSYLFRTYLCCQLCGRRMFGKTRRRSAYYVCAPKKGYLPPDHASGGSYFLREDVLIDKLKEFLAEHVFGAYRRHLLDAHLRHLDQSARQEREQQLTTLRRSIDDTDTKIRRIIRNLELVDDPDPDLTRASPNAGPSSAPANTTCRPSWPTPSSASTRHPTGT